MPILHMAKSMDVAQNNVCVCVMFAATGQYEETETSYPDALLCG